MRFTDKSKERFLLVFPIPGGWEIRITDNEGYETIHLTTEQVWRISELIHDCESVRPKERN